MTTRRRSFVALALLLLVALLASACGDDGDTSTSSSPDDTAASGSSGATTTGAPTEVDLTGVKLRVGDQINGLKSVLEAAGELDDTPYEIVWSEFQNGPALIAAQTGGDVDLGTMAETPVVFAQAAGSPVKVVGASKILDPKKSNLAFIVKNDSPIKSAADLKGKKILNSQGTVLQYLLARALEEEGLTTDDVELVNLQQGGQAAYDQGDIDVSGSGGAFLPIALAKGTDRVIITGSGILPGVSYLVARDGALADAKLSAAIGDFLGRLARAQAWYNANPAEAAQIVKGIYKVDDNVATNIVTLAPAGYVPIDDTIIEPHQEEADFFAEQGLLKQKLDVTKVFDDRFNELVVEATKG